MMQMNKKGVDPKTLVTLVLLAVTLVIFLVGVYPPLQAAIMGKGEKAQCNWNLLISAIVAKVPFAEAIPAECKAKRVNIDNEMLQKEMKYAKKAFEKYRKNLNDPNANWFVNQGSEEEWALDRIIAKELVDCWEKVWKGKLDLFKGGVFTGDTYCVICSRIYFEPDLPISVRDTPNEADMIYSLPAWLQLNNHHGKTYYDFLSEGQTSMSPAKYFYTTQLPYAVIYKELKAPWFEKAAAWINENPWVYLLSLPLMLTPAGWMAVGAVVPKIIMGAMAVGFVTTYMGAVGAISVAAIAPDFGKDAKHLLLVPYNELLTKPIEEGGIGCTQFID